MQFFGFGCWVGGVCLLIGGVVLCLDVVDEGQCGCGSGGGKVGYQYVGVGVVVGGQVYFVIVVVCLLGVECVLLGCVQ